MTILRAFRGRRHKILGKSEQYSLIEGSKWYTIRYIVEGKQHVKSRNRKQGTVLNDSS